MDLTHLSDMLLLLHGLTDMNLGTDIDLANVDILRHLRLLGIINRIDALHGGAWDGRDCGGER